MTVEGSQNLPPPSEANEQQQSYIVPREVLERIPIDQREEFTQKLVDFGIRISQEEHYVGPLQPSREAECWDALVPGTAKRNFDLYEKTATQIDGGSRSPSRQYRGNRASCDGNGETPARRLRGIDQD